MSLFAWGAVLLLAVLAVTGGYAALQHHRHRFAKVLKELEYDTHEGQLRFVRGAHRVEVPSGPHFDLSAPVRLPRAVSPRQPRHEGKGLTGDPLFDRIFFVGVSSPWAFHGLSVEIRQLLGKLADLGEVRGGSDGVRVRLAQVDRGTVSQATDLLVTIGQAAARRDLEHILRTDPVHRVATEALRALHEEDPERADELAFAVRRRSRIWRRERARIRKDVPAIAAVLDQQPDGVRLLDQLDDVGVAEVVATCTRPLPVLLAMKRLGTYGEHLPRPIGRAAWRAIRGAVQDASLLPDERRELVPVWLWARDHVQPRDAQTLGALALQMPEGAVPSVLEALEGTGIVALPELQSLEGTLPQGSHRGLARSAIERLTEAHPQHRGGLSLADARGGALSVAEAREQRVAEA